MPLENGEMSFDGIFETISPLFQKKVIDKD